MSSLTNSPVAAFQRRIVLSSEPDAMRVLPSGENATVLTESSCPRKGFPVATPRFVSHTLIVLSCEQDAIYLPSPENETDVTQRVCRNGSPKAAPDVVFHNRIVLSHEPDTSCEPSGRNARELTTEVCPLNGSPIAARVVASHTRIVSSHDPDAIRVLSGEYAREVTRPECP